MLRILKRCFLIMVISMLTGITIFIYVFGVLEYGKITNYPTCGVEDIKIDAYEILIVPNLNEEYYRKINMDETSNNQGGQMLEASYHGEINITLDILKKCSTLTLFAKGLKIHRVIIEPVSKRYYMISNTHTLNSTTDLLTIHFRHLVYGNYSLKLNFSGSSNYPMPSQYYQTPCGMEQGGREPPLMMTVVNLENHLARTLFPCLDNPAKQATFSISVRYHQKYTIFSPMKIRNEELEENYRTTHFEKTQRVPAIKFAVAVTDCFYLAEKLLVFEYRRGTTTTLCGVNDVKISAYEILIEPDLRRATFDGETNITIEVLKKCDTFALYARDLNILDATIETAYGGFYMRSNNIVNTLRTDSLTIEFYGFLHGNYLLKLKYDGDIKTEPSAFHKRYYYIHGAQVSVAVADLNASLARTLFPCFDDPAQQATFSISIRHLNNYTTLSSGIDDRGHEGNYTTTHLKKSQPIRMPEMKFAVVDNSTEADISQYFKGGIETILGESAYEIDTNYPPCGVEDIQINYCSISIDLRHNISNYFTGSANMYINVLKECDTFTFHAEGLRLNRAIINPLSKDFYMITENYTTDSSQNLMTIAFGRLMYGSYTLTLKYDGHLKLIPKTYHDEVPNSTTIRVPEQQPVQALFPFVDDPSANLAISIRHRRSDTVTSKFCETDFKENPDGYITTDVVTIRRSELSTFNLMYTNNSDGYMTLYFEIYQ